MVVLDPSGVASGSKEMKEKKEEAEKKGLSSMDQRASLLQWFNSTATAKLKAVQQYIKDLLAADKKFLVFCHHQVSEYILDRILNPAERGITFGITSGLSRYPTTSLHQVMIKGVESLLEKENVGYIKIDGNVASQARKVMVDKFQTQDGVKVAVLSITAASCGITLTAAHLVVFAELFWNPGILCQAEDRAHRIGQSDSVVCQYLVAR